MEGTEEREPTGARAGQVLVMFAVFLTGMIGMLGLATDLGVAFAGRRSMQNAADLAAVAGARTVAKSLSNTSLRAETDVNAVAAANGFAGGTMRIESCFYVDDANERVGSCTAPVTPQATGVEVTVAETHQTLFMRAVPGAPRTVTTRATAIAHVRRLGNVPPDGPFLVCGVDTKLAGGGSMSILESNNGTWRVNPGANGQTFIVHGPQAERCDAKSSRFKGVADQRRNDGKSLPNWYGYNEGDTAGPIRQSVRGVEGCQAGSLAVNCVAYLPIVVNTPRETDNSRELWTVAYLAFFITEPKSNEHYGRLIADYVVWDSGVPGWDRTTPGPVVIRLTS